ncbi:MAG: hypothetical protein CBC25_05815 [Pelagibacteraceae bacterium TMED65]|nr:MAG: hypothetical protein CBC25_05815 [Pelagibacteraceae bacterium TMED65]|tara:strand:+ start:1207 stop:1995 length:789 start_codon:yes stop_codon:yes gene_type:complete
MKKIFINGVWKSGNHLIYSALNTLGLKGPTIGFASHLLKGKLTILKKIMRSRSINNKNKIDIGLDTICEIDKSWIKKKITTNKNHIIGGHCKYSEGFDNLINECDLKKIIILRDPRDILLSFCDWIKKEKDYFLFDHFYNKSNVYIIESLLNGFTYKKTKFYSFKTTLKGFNGWLNTNNKLIIKYEELINNKTNSEKLNLLSKKIVNFLEFNSIEKLDREKYFGKSKTFMIGKENRWKRYERKDLIKKIEYNCNDEIKKWGY